MTMIYYDSHVHTAFSTDSDAPMEQMVRRGIQNGLRGITFTDHMDYHFPSQYDWNTEDARPPFTFDMDSYVGQIETFREIYKNDIDIYCGVEIGLKEDAVDDNVKLSHDERLDYCIGSIHLVDNMDPYDAKFWEAFDEKEAFTRYFEATLENLKTDDIHLDTLGHLDYIVRYSPSGYRIYSYRMFAEVLDEILRRIIDRGISLEVNTSGYKNGSPMPNPHRDIIARYKELGGELITFGSDAHGPELLCGRFKDAQALVRNAGFAYYTTFVNHKPAFHSLT